MNGKRILFIDDEESMVVLAKEMLEDLGYVVTSHTCSSKALQHFKNHPDHFDLVVTDFDMPVMDGALLAKHLQSIRQDIPVILSTGRRNVTKTMLGTWGIDAMITKPYYPEEIDEIIRRITEPTNPLCQ